MGHESLCAAGTAPSRYGTTAAVARTQETHQRQSPGDRLEVRVLVCPHRGGGAGRLVRQEVAAAHSVLSDAGVEVVRQAARTSLEAMGEVGCR